MVYSKHLPPISIVQLRSNCFYWELVNIALGSFSLWPQGCNSTNAVITLSINVTLKKIKQFRAVVLSYLILERINPVSNANKVYQSEIKLIYRQEWQGTSMLIKSLSCVLEQ